MYHIIMTHGVTRNQHILHMLVGNNKT